MVSVDFPFNPSTDLHRSPQHGRRRPSLRPQTTPQRWNAAAAEIKAHDGTAELQLLPFIGPEERQDNSECLGWAK